MELTFKRLTLLCGHYGSGKTNVAVNLALELRRRFDKTALADLDIVNPYFRAKDSKEMLESRGIRCISSEFANSNVDLPSLPQEIYALTDDKSLHAVLDIGGDERGALALGRLAPLICAENDYEMYLVINKYRPLTPDAESTVEVLREIEYACRIPFTGIVNNSNLGAETTAETVLSSCAYAEETAKLAGLPLVMTAVEESLFRSLTGKIGNLFPIALKKQSFGEL